MSTSNNSQNIKAQYKELIELLENNKRKKIATIMPDILALVSSQRPNKTFKTDDDGNVTHIFCYYHKEWEALDEVDYGRKKHSTTGFNTMCKQGLSHWSRQQRNAKKAKSELLESLANGDIDQDAVEDQLILIEQNRKEIVSRAEL